MSTLAREVHRHANVKLYQIGLMTLIAVLVAVALGVGISYQHEIYSPAREMNITMALTGQGVSYTNGSLPKIRAGDTVTFNILDLDFEGHEVMLIPDGATVNFGQYQFASSSESLGYLLKEDFALGKVSRMTVHFTNSGVFTIACFDNWRETSSTKIVVYK